jgi:hypothetical protein
MRLLFLILLIYCVAFSCKTKQQSSAGSDSATVKKQATAKVDSSGTKLSTLELEDDSYQEQESTTVAFAPMDSAGFTIFKPFTTVLRNTSGQRSKTKAAEQVTLDLIADRTLVIDSTGQSDYKSEASIETPSVVGEIAGALFSSLLKIAALIIGLISTALITRAAIKKSKQNGIPPA